MSAPQRTSSLPAPGPLAATAAGWVLVEDFEAVFLRFQGPITRFIYHRIGNRELSYDLAQDVFVKAYKALLGGTVVYQEVLSAWLFRIALNSTTDSLRRNGLLAFLPLSLFHDDRGISTRSAGRHAGEGDGAGSAALVAADTGQTLHLTAGGRFEDGVAEREILRRVFTLMPRRYATCLYLAELEGLSGAEIAAVLSISLSALKSRLTRARESFLKLYRQETGEAGAA